MASSTTSRMACTRWRTPSARCSGPEADLRVRAVAERLVGPAAPTPETGLRYARDHAARAARDLQVSRDFERPIRLRIDGEGSIPGGQGFGFFQRRRFARCREIHRVMRAVAERLVL